MLRCEFSFRACVDHLSVFGKGTLTVAWFEAASDFSPGEQTNGPTEMQTALRTLGNEYMAFSSLMVLHKQLNPFWHLQYYRCHRTLREILLPHVQKRLDAQTEKSKDPSAPTTIIDVALKELQQEGFRWSAKSRENFIEDVIGLTKQFIFAGHETTAITLSFAIHYLSKDPEMLQKIVRYVLKSVNLERQDAERNEGVLTRIAISAR